MTDTGVYLFINGLAGKIPVLDEFIKGISNDYFTLILTCLILVWIWFGTRDSLQREINQKAVITAIISVGLVSAMVAIMNQYYFRDRPFNALPADLINLLYYRPHDSSFPANFAAVIFALVMPVFFKNKSYGSFLLALAIVACFGRIYVGIHYPLDIIGGLAIGLLASIMAYIIGQRFSTLLSFVIIRLQGIYLA
jgi:undecaprenyl-diphosphatase